MNLSSFQKTWRPFYVILELLPGIHFLLLLSRRRGSLSRVRFLQCGRMLEHQDAQRIRCPLVMSSEQIKALNLRSNIKSYQAAL
jgi:hypothetical protein